jgi:hypothetical protein
VVLAVVASTFFLLGGVNMTYYYGSEYPREPLIIRFWSTQGHFAAWDIVASACVGICTPRLLVMTSPAFVVPAVEVQQ